MRLPPLLSVAVLAAALAVRAGLSVAPGDLAPRFSLQRLGEPTQRVSLRQYADSARKAADPSFGKPVLLSFWSVACVPCRQELPRLSAWAAERPGVLFLPVLVDADDAAAARLLAQIGVDPKGLHDRYQVVGRNYGVCLNGLCNLPSLVGIAADGRVVWASQGFHPSEPIESRLDSALGLPGRR